MTVCAAIDSIHFRYKLEEVGQDISLNSHGIEGRALFWMAFFCFFGTVVSLMFMFTLCGCFALFHLEKALGDVFSLRQGGSVTKCVEFN